MIPEGHTIEDIKKREQIIREFYREWKEKNPSQRKFNISLKVSIKKPKHGNANQKPFERMMIMEYELCLELER